MPIVKSHLRRNVQYLTSSNKKKLQKIKREMRLKQHRIIKTKTLDGKTIYVLTT